MRIRIAAKTLADFNVAFFSSLAENGPVSTNGTICSSSLCITWTGTVILEILGVVGFREHFDAVRLGPAHHPLTPPIVDGPCETFCTSQKLPRAEWCPSPTGHYIS